MKTVDIKGKPYVEVNERIKYFRTNYPEWSLVSDLVSCENGVCIIKANIIDNVGIVRATGIAYEKEGSTFINKTSYIENCETSAWGRALGNLGIGIDTSIASLEEVQNAVLNQESAEDVAKMDLKEIGNIKITFGKHNGKTLKEIYKTDKDYLLWLHDNSKEEYLRLACFKMLEAVDKAKGKESAKK